ncbi:transketolase C-terminal domain-containing protein [Fusibacter bizertensis]|uniref:Transketolase C-terminal domain-containing protein n=1 Tax=Fusibacter bizertensis TaxID=1488331 RepID=A0ABT6NCC6_9FIRM|nr:transketolase C-terminal domain-containing protein [Fusibacter bizertensis]MDH8678083.1 transketolase C-terminal domain-containing protein [Fusibacter bizertensis]
MSGESTRQAFGDVIIDIAAENEKIFVIDCDIGKSMKTVGFSQKYPERHINVGIAEQNAAGVAAGLATLGKIPIVSTYAVFGSMRMLEQIRTSACYAELNVKVFCSHGGLTPANDGPTHQAIEDFGIYRTIPNMTVIMPADYESCKALIKEAINMDGPVYMRFTRDAMPFYYSNGEPFEIGKGKVLKEGTDLTIIANGDMVHEALKAVAILEAENISVELIDMHTIKPIDEALILKTLSKTKKIITVEDHNVINGLGSAVADIVAQSPIGIMRKIGLNDRFGESGPYHDLLKKFKMDFSEIVSVAKELI